MSYFCKSCRCGWVQKVEKAKLSLKPKSRKSTMMIRDFVRSLILEVAERRKLHDSLIAIWR